MVTREQVLKALQTVNDPELRLNIVDLGLVYDVDLTDEGEVFVLMSLTSPGCPVGDLIVDEAQKAVMAIEGVKDAKVAITFNPPWTEDRMSERLKKLLRMGMRP